MTDDRARSFIERYIIARAFTFRVDHEQEDMHACTLMAKSAYRHIANVAKNAEPTTEEYITQTNAADAAQGGAATGRLAGAAGPVVGPVALAPPLNVVVVPKGYMTSLMNKAKGAI